MGVGNRKGGKGAPVRLPRVEDMTATDILHALKRWWPNAAFVPELTTWDDEAIASEGFKRGEAEYRRIDALMMEDKIRTAMEIKVDRADAARETWAKTRPWRIITHRFLYATPAGLIDRPPVQNGAGLVWVHEDGSVEWRVKCKMNTSAEPLPQLVIQRLADRAAALWDERQAPRHRVD